MNETGWFGIPGAPETCSSKVHFVQDRVPICHAPLRKGQQFQVCAVGWKFKLVECQRCKNIANRLQVSPFD